MRIQLFIVVGLATIFAAHGLEEQTAPKPSKNHDVPNNASSPLPNQEQLPSQLGQEEALKLLPLQDSAGSLSGRRGRLGFNTLVFYPQSTITAVRTRIVSSIFTCLSTGSTASCTGRRRRATLIKELPLDLAPEEDSSLHGSTNVEASAQPIEKIDWRTGERVTVGSTILSTLTLTGTTVTVSAICNNDGGTALVNTCFLGQKSQ